MAKGKPTHPPHRLTKKQASRRRREAEQTRWIWIAVAAIAAVVADYTRPPSLLIVQVEPSPAACADIIPLDLFGQVV